MTRLGLVLRYTTRNSLFKTLRRPKFFARVALHVVEVISNRFDPWSQAIAGALPLATWSRLADDPVGLRRLAAGLLQTKWG